MTAPTEARAQVEALIRSGSLSVEDLLSAALGASQMPAGLNGLSGRVPTVTEFVTTAERAARSAHFEDDRGGGTLRTYRSYWRMFAEGYPYQRQGIRKADGSRVGAEPIPPDERLYEGCGAKLLTGIGDQDMREFIHWVTIRARLDSHWRTLRREEAGRAVRHTDQKGAVRNAVGAMRFFFDVAAGERHLLRAGNPALILNKPPKARGNRRAFTEKEYRELWSVIINGGDDPELDALIFETVFVTGARRGGIIAMNIRDLDPDRATVVLREKGKTVVEQPATRDLVQRILRSAAQRGSTRPDDPAFCFRDGLKTGVPRRITSRRFDYLHERIQKALPWADKLGVTSHFCRFHAIVQVERLTGSPAIARAFARHEASSVTDIYTQASFAEVARAVGLMTGTVHPLAEET